MIRPLVPAFVLTGSGLRNKPTGAIAFLLAQWLNKGWLYTMFTSNLHYIYKEKCNICNASAYQKDWRRCLYLNGEE